MLSDVAAVIEAIASPQIQSLDVPSMALCKLVTIVITVLKVTAVDLVTTLHSIYAVLLNYDVNEQSTGSNKTVLVMRYRSEATSKRIWQLIRGSTVCVGFTTARCTRQRADCRRLV